MEDTTESAHEDTTQSTGDGSQLDDEEYCSESAASATPQDISDGSSMEADISTSGNSAAILNFRERSTCSDVGGTATGAVDPENVGVAVGILTICFVVSEMLLLPVGWLPSWIFDMRQGRQRLSVVWKFRTQ